MEPFAPGQLQIHTAARVLIHFQVHVYRDENGTLVARVETVAERSKIIPWGLKQYSFDWSMEVDQYSRGSVDLELTGGKRLHVTLSVGNQGTTCIGLYAAGLDRYIWLELPVVSQSGRDYSFSLSSPDIYRFALKNSGTADNEYGGWYYITAGG